MAKSSYTAALRSQHCCQQPSGKATLSNERNRIHICEGISLLIQANTPLIYRNKEVWAFLLLVVMFLQHITLPFDMWVES